jgi:hypothetical protein
VGVPWRVSLSGGELLRDAGAGFGVSLLPLLVDVGGRLVSVGGRFGVVSDSGVVLGVVKGRYRPLQFSDVFGVVSGLVSVSGGGLVGECLGVVRGGAVFFVVVDAGGGCFVVVRSSHDGSVPLSFVVLHVDVVSGAVLFVSDGFGLTFRHTPEVVGRLGLLDSVVGLVAGSREFFGGVEGVLSGVSVDVGRAERVLCGVFGGESRARDVAVEGVLGLFSGVWGERFGLSGWGLFGAACEWLDWFRPGDVVERGVTAFDPRSWVCRRKLLLCERLLGLV